MSIRKIQKIFRSRPVIEGAGVHLRRAFGFGNTELFDPFLLFDDFRSNNPEFYLKGFPWHPHRGIETITYMLQGSVEHGDSMGNKGIIMPGDLQWMTAGSGIIHQEMPKGDNKGLMGGFQLWANLPAKNKMKEPIYRDVKNHQIPQVKIDNGVLIKIICGKIGDIGGPISNIEINPEYFDITVPKNTTYLHPTKLNDTVLVYIIEGNGNFCEKSEPFTFDIEGENYFDMKKQIPFDNHTLIVFGKGDEISIKTKNDPIRFLLFAGKPIREPIAWYGPIVMNTQEELRIAFEEFDEGTFIKHKNAKISY